MANFVVQFLLKTEIFQEDTLNKRFEIGRKIYNALVNLTFKRYEQMTKTKIYRGLMDKYHDDKKKISKELSELRNIYKLSEYAFHSDIKAMQKHFKTHIDSFTAQKIASWLWKSYEKLLFGNVGLDIGTQTIAVASAIDVKIYELADKVQNIENEKRHVQRILDRSRRATNPDNFNNDGTIKKQGNKKVLWIKSNKYLKNQKKLRELYRKQSDIRKLQHEIMANEIITLGNNIYVETMNFKGLQKRSKKTEKDEQGKYKRKKRFGKSIANKAPSMFLSILDRKLINYGTKLNKIDTWSVKASQYDHSQDSYKKKKLSQRWDNIDGKQVQRDMYSAFLIMNVTKDMKSVDKSKCDKEFFNFLKLHNMEVKRLSGNRNLSSIAI